MTQTGADTWFIGSTVGSTQKTTYLTCACIIAPPSPATPTPCRQTNKRLKTQLWSYVVLEGYGVTGAGLRLQWSVADDVMQAALTIPPTTYTSPICSSRRTDSRCVIFIACHMM